MLSSAADTAQGFNNSQGKPAGQGKTSRPWKNQQGSSQQAPTCVPGLSRSLLQRLSPALHPLSALADAEAELPFSKEGKKPPRSFVSWAAATRRLRSWGGVRHEATSLPRDPSRGGHILLPLLKQPFSTAQGATQLLKSGICPVSLPGSQAAVLESTESSCL